MSAEFCDTIVSHIPALRAYARVLQQDREAADDLVQDCLARAVEKQHLWQPGTNLKSWLFTILRNLFINDVRRHNRRPDTLGDPKTQSNLSQPEQQTGVTEVQELEFAFHQLPEQHRTALALVVIQGMQYKEAAEILDMPVGTIRSRISRARQELRQGLDCAEEVRSRSTKKALTE